jgi:hypothetical protein
VANLTQEAADPRTVVSTLSSTKCRERLTTCRERPRTSWSRRAGWRGLAGNEIALLFPRYLEAWEQDPTGAPGDRPRAIDLRRAEAVARRMHISKLPS